MIRTKCDNCCFLKQDQQGHGCVLGQLCYRDNDDNNIYTPGCCRLKRNAKWNEVIRKNNLDPQKQVFQECKLVFSMIVVFNDDIHNINDIKYTIEHDQWYKKYCNKIIIASSKKSKNSKLLIDYVKEKNNIIVDFTMDGAKDHVIIKRISRNITTRYFMIIEAGKQIENLDCFNNILSNGSSHALYWYFPEKYGNTIVSKVDPMYGLYLTRIFNLVVETSNKNISEQIKEVQGENFSLSEFFHGCNIVYDEKNK